MSKTLSWICSILLTATTVTGAEAAVQNYVKDSASPAHRALTQRATATPQKAPTGKKAAGFEMMKARTVRTSGFTLKEASTRAPYKAARTADLPMAKVPGTVVHGNVLFMNTWDENFSQPGLYSIPTAEGGAFQYLEVQAPGAYGGVAQDGIYYSTELINFFGMFFITVYGTEIESGELVYQESGAVTDVAIGQALNSADGKIYGACYNADLSGYNLATMDYSGGVPSTQIIGAIDTEYDVAAFTVDNQGNGWAVLRQIENDACVDSYLAKIDLATAEVTVIGSTGLQPQYITGMTYDPKSSTIFYTLSTDAEGCLVTLDPTTGAAAKVCDFEGNAEVTGLYVPVPAAEDNAPAAIADFTATFTDGSLEGKVTFTCPKTLFDGTDATGELTYVVTANGTEVATGTTAYGAEVEATVAVPESGMYKVAAYVKNENGNGPTSSVKMYIGHDIVKAPTNVAAAYADGKMTITWDAVTEGINGGFVNPAEVTYTVTCISPDSAVVATGLTATECVVEFAAPENITKYVYNVTANYDGNSSLATASNAVVLGNIQLPYTQDFDVASALDEMIIIDANGDGNTWTFYDGQAGVQYNSSMAMDDWMITPTLKLEAGKVYEVSFKTSGRSTYYIERLEVKFGNAPTVEAMTNTLVEPMDINVDPTGAFLVEGTIVPTEDGDYYIGFHGISDADQYYLYVDEINISAGLTAESPNIPTNFTAKGDSNGALEVTLNFTAPAVNYAGGELASLTKAEITCDGELVKTIETIAPGESVTYVHATTEGMHTFGVTCFNEAGAGKTATVNAYCGVDYPAPVQNATVVETATPGEVTVSWDAVTTDVNGTELNPSLIKYNVYAPDGQARVLVAEGLEETSFTTQAVPAGEQDFVQYLVFAVTSRGEGDGSYTDLIAAGTPFDGLVESFANGTISYPFAINTAGGASVQLMTDESLSLPSQDGDNGFLAISGNTPDMYGSLITAKVSLANAVNPGISFYTYNVAEGDDNQFAVAVREAGTEEYTTLGEYVVMDVCDVNNWGKVTISLDAYAGKTIEVMLTATVKTYVYNLFDNLKIGSMVPNDLVASAINAPAKVATGTDYNVDVTVANEGTANASAFTVELYADGEVAATQEVSALESGERAVLSFTRSMSPLAEEPVTYKAVVVYAADEAVANNTTSEIVVTPKVSTLPKATDLKAVKDGDNVYLSWTEPDLSGVSETVNEGFENADSWAHEYADWTFVDGDQSAVGGFQGLTVPGITPGQTLASFFIFDATEDGFNETFAAHSGDKYIASMFRYDDGQADDWSISPVLSGNAQTITFFAKSYSSSYPETIEMLYSTGSTDPADFIKVDEVVGLPDQWTEYSFDVPEGAMHFAIRSCATGSFMLMLDDFTFESGNTGAEITILGYNVYCDGVKVNAEPVEECNFTTALPEQISYYRVTVLYDRGESAGSNTATFDPTAIDAIAGNAVAVKAVKGQILVSGAEGQMVTVNSVEGKTIYTANGTNSMAIDVNAGVYVVTVGRTVAKVLVR